MGQTLPRCSSPPFISIILPAKNGRETIGTVLDAIFAQETDHPFEVIVIDSGSTDGTPETVGRYPARLYRIAPEEFSHSRTRNYGASLADPAAKFLVFLNQDAVPSDRGWLDNLVRSMGAAEDLKAVCAAELLYEPVYFNVTGVASYVFRTSATKGVHLIEPHILENSSSMARSQQRELFPFSTVCAMFDRDHFTRFPFNENAVWGEDLHWAVENSRNGYRSGCTTLASVFHHHDYTDAELHDIAVHTVRLYREVFGWSFAAERYVTPQDILMDRSDPQVRALTESMSWKITAPLRWLHARLRALGGR